MPNNLSAYVTKFTTNLDKVIGQAALTSDLNMNGNLVGELTGAGTVKVGKLTVDGLATHTRGGGFTRGGATLEWEDVKLAYERDREFSIDTMDDEETDAVVSANVMNEFARTKVVPEVDAIRFAKLAANAGNTAAATFSTADAAVDAVLKAEEVMQDLGSPLSSCVLYLNAATKTLLRKATPHLFGTGEGPNTNFDTYDEMKLVPVPQGRFYSKIALNDGKTAGQTAGGYAKATDAIDINFMVVNPSCAAAITKHEKLRYFAPDTNQTDDAHLWQYRLYHDLFVYKNQKGLIYMHTKAAQ